ncbi:MAG TPA: class I SAM-dependent methyltransferase [Candidatus Saccharimonadia bacterium]|nr:class I SAM-dependent methyltransferase [Candidatus Saccharimonadia bacterium]
MPWEHVDTGWGRCAPEFAYLFENLHWREYIHLLDQTGVGPGTRYLDIACGCGLAVRLAGERGALAGGLDASPRLAAIAAARSPEADIRVGDMFALPFPDHSFEVATSFRGIWGNGLDALREARRVVCPGGKIGLSFWGHQKQMQAYPLFAVLGQTSQAEREHTGELVRIGRPGAAEELMRSVGLEPGSRTSLHFSWEFPDVDLAARALAASGPAYLAIQHLGAEAFMAAARDAAAQLYVPGIGVRAEVEVHCLVGVVLG